MKQGKKFFQAATHFFTEKQKKKYQEGRLRLYQTQKDTNADLWL